jgi:branched-chain amino acid transport system ATP-binding protein
MSAPLLQLDDLHVVIQSMEALRGFSLNVGTGEMVGLVGRNGAGKTTAMRTIMGHLAPVRGSVRFEGRDMSALPAMGGPHSVSATCRRTASSCRS